MNNILSRLRDAVSPFFRHFFVATCVLLGSVHVHAKVNFDIPTQALDQALIDFAQQADTTLLFPYDLAKQETSRALRGKYDVALALVLLLEGSQLYPLENNDGTFSLRPISAKDDNKDKQDSSKGRLFKTHNKIVLKVEEQTLDRIAIVGSRSSPRSVIESAVPLDIIGADRFNRQGSTDMLSMLSTLVPSFNVNDQPINDAASLVRPANLRGMASDHTLVLMNGKRRHRSAVITFLGGGLSDGAQGPDMATIPVAALKQVEVLRDGAAAQYGSDAIAGVLNFVLRDDAEGGMLEFRTGQYYDGDGDLLQLHGNMGFAMGNDGFINVSLEHRQQQATSRSVQRDDARALILAGNAAVPVPAQVWGSPNLDYDHKLLVNLGHAISASSQWYSFVNLAQRQVEGGFYYRNPHTRSGVYAGGLDDTGTPLLLVADLDGQGQGIECPLVPITDSNVLDDTAFLAINADTPVGNNCFAFNEILPGGFTPQFGGKIQDAAWVMGIKGQNGHDWFYDISAGVGYSKIEYFLRDTVNPSLGADTPFSFSPGAASQYERSVNIDLSKAFDVGLQDEINFALGFEWRRERYAQQAGDPASYAVGDLAFDANTGLSQGFGVGSNGFPGYRPEAAGDWTRGNIAFYADVETYLTPEWLLGMAVRYEDFTDFGATFNGKLSSRYELTEHIALRGAVSTGFKAPTVGQSNVVNVTTAFSRNGLEDQATLPPTNPIAAQLGATPLTPEESQNVSLGMVGKLAPELFFTFDYFRIRLQDRLSTTSALPITDEDIQALLAQGVADATSFSSVKFFTNDFDTVTQGVDLVVNYETDWLLTESKFTFAYNWTDTQVDRLSLYPRLGNSDEIVLAPNLTPQRVRMIEDNLPAHRFSLSMQQQFARIHTLVRMNYASGFYEDHLDASGGLDIEGSGELTFDVEVAYVLDNQVQISLGAKNLFDNRPDDNPFAGLVGAEFPPTSPIGINGGFYYLRSRYQF